MLKVVIQDDRHIRPFNERARDLRIRNKPLWLLQRDHLNPYTTGEMEIPLGSPLPASEGPMIVYRDNLVFDEPYLTAFMQSALELGRPVRAALSKEDPAFREHALPLSDSYTEFGNYYLADLWYYPAGPQEDAEPLVIESQSLEVGYYHVPTYMASEQGDLTFHVPKRGLLAIDSWVHIFVADVVYGLFSRGARFEDRVQRSALFKLGILFRALYEGRQILQSSNLVRIGRNSFVDPSAVIHGPTTIGNNCTIGAGVVIDNCIIGNNVNISQGSQIMLSVVGDGCFLPFRASLFMTTLMDNSMVAQNACLQMCVIGRNTFIGAGTTFTDFNLIPNPIRARDGADRLTESNRPVLGGCVGHNCRLGSGMTVFPARTIESDVVLVASSCPVIDHDISYEDSYHHKVKSGHLHRRLYPRPGETSDQGW